jgi:hypothetical protein
VADAVSLETGRHRTDIAHYRSAALFAAPEQEF